MSAQKAYGATLERGDALQSGVPTFTQVAGVRSIGEFTITAEMADATHHSSTGGFREYINTGIFDVSELEIELLYDDTEATHANAAGGVRYHLLNEEFTAWRINFADTGATVWTFDARIAETGDIIDTGEGVLIQRVLMRPSGQPTLS